MTPDEKFTAALEKAVADRGADWVYPKDWKVAGKDEDGDIVSGPTCQYVWGDQPGCIIGYTLHELGTELAELRKFEFSGAYQVVSIALPEVSQRVLLAAMEAQMQQDAGKSWGEALEEYRRVLAHPRKVEL